MKFKLGKNQFLIFLSSAFIGLVLFGLLERGNAKILNLEAYKINVLNGSGIPGSADTAKKLLSSRGFERIDTGNASTFDNKKTVVTCKRDIPSKVCNTVEDSLKDYYTITKLSRYLNVNSVYDVEVIVGQEFSSKQEDLNNLVNIENGIYTNKKYGFKFKYPVEVFPPQFTFVRNSEQAIFHQDFKINPETMGTVSDGIRMLVIMSDIPAILQRFDDLGGEDGEQFVESIDTNGIPGYITKTNFYVNGNRSSIVDTITTRWKKNGTVVMVRVTYDKEPISREKELKAILDTVINSIEFFDPQGN